MTSFPRESNPPAPRPSEDAAALVMEVVPLVMRTLRAEARDSRMPDLSVPQFRALNFLYRHPGASLSDVADHVGTTLPSMSKLVEKLVARGLVTRQDDPGDRRRVTLALTDAGRADLQAAREAAHDHMAERLAALSAQEQACVAEAMRVLREVFSAERPSPLTPLPLASQRTGPQGEGDRKDSSSPPRHEAEGAGG